MRIFRTPLFLWAAAGLLLLAAECARAADVADYSWVFSENGNYLGWTAEDADTSGVDSGYLWAESDEAVTYYVHQDVPVQARKDHYVQLRLRLRPKSSPTARFGRTYGGIYFTTDAETSFDEAKKVTFCTYGTGTWKTYNIWMGNNAKWSGTIRRLRVDPTTFPDARIEIESIKLMQDHTGPEFILKNNWTYSDNDTISYNTPSLVLKDAYDKISDLSRVEFYRRPAGGTNADWVLAGGDISAVDKWQFKYPALPNGSYDLGVKAYDQASNSNNWDYPEAIVHNLTINTALTPRIDVDAAGSAEPFDKLIAGNNQIWYRWSDSYNPATNSLYSSSLESLLADCGITVIRYPGGCHADTFYWKKSIGPVESRPVQYGNPCAPVPSKQGPAKFGLDEFCRWCEARGIEPMITTRFRWPTAGGAPGQDGPHPYQEALDDAVDLVEYCNAPNDGSNWNGGTDWAAVRAANGHPEPYHLKYIEIGNEPFNPDPWGSPGLVGLDGPSEYALAFLSYYDAIKATDPSVIVTPSAYLDYHGANYGNLVDKWPYHVLSIDGPFIEEAQFHQYYPYSPSQPDIVRLYNETMAAAKAFDDGLGVYRMIQKQTNPDRTDLIKIQLNEWNVNYYWSNNPTYGWINMEHVRTWKAALATADSLRIFLLNRDLLSVACHWLMQDDRWGLVQNDNVTPNPVWYVFSAFNHHFGTKLIPSKFTGAPTLDWDGYQGQTPSLLNIPKLTGMASLSEDGQTAYLWVINKDRSNPITSAVNLAGFLKPGQTRLHAEIWEHNSLDVDDYTTKRNVYRNITNALYDPSFNYTFPAHSLTTFKITAAPQSGGTAPQIAIGAPSLTATSTQDVSYTVTYNGAYEVTLSPADITLEATGSAVATVTVSGSGPTYRTVTLRNISGDGELRIRIAVGTAHDGLGNYAPAAGPSGTVTVDNTAAQVTIGVPSLAATRNGPVSYPVSFVDAASVNLTAEHVTLNATGTAAGTVSVSGSGLLSRTVTIDGISGDGTLSISIAAGAAQDVLGNLSEAAGPGSAVVVDNTAPSVRSIAGPSVSLTNTGPVSYTVMFTEAVTGFDSAEDIQISASGTAQVGSVGISVDGSGPSAGPYTVTLGQVTGDGSIGIAVKEGACADLVGLTNGVGVAQDSFLVDNTAPTVSIGAPSEPATRSGPVTYTVTYAGAETVTLTPSLVTLHKMGTANGTVGVSGTGTTRTVTVSGVTGDGELSISIAAESASDAAGNRSAAVGPSASFLADNTPPTITIGPPSSSVTGAGPVTYTVTYGGAAGISLTAANVTLNKTGTADGLVVVSGTGGLSRTVTVNGITGNGTLGISLAAGTAIDAVGNTALAAGPSVAFTVDNSILSVAIGPPSASLTASGPVTYGVHFTDAALVTMNASHVTLHKTGTANGVVSVSGSGLTDRLVTISGITGDGTLSISIAAGAASGRGGNPSPASGPASPVTVDNTAPGVSIGAPSPAIAGYDGASFTVNYTGADSVSLAADDITLHRTGTATGTVSVTGSGKASRTVRLTGLTGNGTLAISIAAGTASDTLGHTAPAAGPSQALTVDTLAPGISLSAPSVQRTARGPVTYTVTFTDASVVLLAPSDVRLITSGNVTASIQVTGSGVTSRTITVADVNGNGDLALQLRPGTAQDSAGNTTAGIGPTAVVLVDNMAPAPVTVSDEGRYTFSTSVLRGSWTPSSDGTGVGLAGYEYGIGTSPAIPNVRDWTSAGLNLSASVSGLSLVPGQTYYLLVRAVDILGHQSAVSASDGIAVALPVERIGMAWQEADGAGITLLNKVVTDSVPGQFWIQEADRSAAVKVISDVPVEAGDVVNIAGALTISGGQRVFAADVVEIVSSAELPLAPWINLGNVGGKSFNAATPGITNGHSLYNVGLMVTAVGAITYISTADSNDQYFYMRDGSEPAASGVRVSTGSSTPPAGGMVRVTGIIGLRQNGALLEPELTVTDAARIQPVAATEPFNSIGPPSPASSSAGPVTFTVTYGGAASITLKPSDVVLTRTGTANAAVSVTGSGNVYRQIVLTGLSGSGAIAVGIRAGTAVDSENRASRAAGPSTPVIVDNTAPRVSSISAPSVTATKRGPVSYTVMFTEPVTGFNASSDVTVSRTGTAEVGVVTISGTGAGPYTVMLSSLTGEGTLRISVPAGAASDAAGNPNAASAVSAAFSADSVAPTLVLDAPSAGYTNTGPVTYTAIYGGATAVNLTAADITLVKTGTATGTVAVSGTGTAVRTITISGITGNGTLAVYIAPGTASDNAGNLAPESGAGVPFVVDNIAPKVTVSEPSRAVAGEEPVSYIISYEGADAVTLSEENVTLEATGTASGQVEISGSGRLERAATITGITGEGTLAIALSPGTATDRAGNLAPATGPSASFVVDSEGPSVTIGPPSVSAVSSGPVSFVISYAGADTVTLAPEAVTLLKTGTANGTLSVTGSGTSERTVTVSDITGEGSLGISIAAGTASDAAANTAGAAGPSQMVTVDRTPPGVVIGAPSAAVTRTGPVSFPVTYYGASAITLSVADVGIVKTGTATGTVSVSGTGDTERTITLSQITGEGTLAVSLARGTAADAAGNQSPGAGPSASFFVDNVPPSLSVSAPSVAQASRGPVTYTVTYTGADAVTLGAGDVTLVATGSAWANVEVYQSAPLVWTVALTNLRGDGTLAFQIAAGTARDALGNTAPAFGPSQAFVVDSTPPGISIGPPSVAATATGPVSFAVTYSGAAVVTLKAEDVVLNTAGTATGSVSVSGSSLAERTVTVTNITGQGTIGISIAAGSAVDAAGNAAPDAGPSAVFEASSLPIGVTIGAPSAAYARGGPVTFPVSYTGALSVTLSSSDITLDKTGTAYGTVSVSGTGTQSRLVTISNITGGGTLCIRIKAGTASGPTGSAPAAGPSQAFAVDNTAPAVSISGPSVGLTRNGPVTYTVNYVGADIITLDLPDITLKKTGSAIGTMMVSGTGEASRTVTIMNITGDGTLGISIGAGTASDFAGNAAGAPPATAAFAVDNTAPTLSIGAPNKGLSSTGPVTFTVWYSGASAITLAPEDVIIHRTGTADGTASISTSGSARIVTLSNLTGDGTLGISIPAGTATDAVGNTASGAGPSAAFTVDNTPPTIALSGPSKASTVSGPVDYTVTYGGFSNITLAASHVTLNTAGTANGTVSVHWISANQRVIRISNITGSGTLGISVAAGTAVDFAGLPAPATGPSTAFTAGSGG